MTARAADAAQRTASFHLRLYADADAQRPGVPSASPAKKSSNAVLPRPGHRAPSAPGSHRCAPLRPAPPSCACSACRSISLTARPELRESRNHRAVPKLDRPTAGRPSTYERTRARASRVISAEPSRGSRCPRSHDNPRFHRALEVSMMLSLLPFLVERRMRLTPGRFRPAGRWGCRSCAAASSGVGGLCRGCTGPCCNPRSPPAVVAVPVEGPGRCPALTTGRPPGRSGSCAERPFG